jgi:outer membrane protein TolC
MLMITARSDSGSLCLHLEGSLSGPWVKELERCWQQLNSLEGVAASLNLSGTTYVDAAGQELLERMHRAGFALREAEGAMIRQIVRQIERRGKSTGRPAKGTSIAAILLILFCFLPLRAMAQEPRNVLRLSLPEAVRMALRQNPEAQMAAIDLAVQKQDKAIALAGLLPQAAAATGVSAVKYNTDVQIGHYITGFPREAGPYEVFTAGGAFQMPLFDLTLWRRYQAQREGVGASAAAQSSVREQIALLTVSQYLGCQRATADLEASHSRVTLAQAMYELAQHMEANGIGTSIDTLRANVQLQSEKQREIVASTVLQTSLYGLARLVNADPSQNLEVTDKLEAGAAAPAALPELLQQAWARRPEMAALEAKRRIAAYTKQAARESRLPTVGAAGAWGYMGTSAGTALPSYVYSVTATVPLFTGGRIHAENVKADLEMQRVDREREQWRQKIALEVKVAVAQSEAARNEVEVARLAVQLASEEVTQARDRFEAGVANNIELITAQDALAKAQDGLTSALYRLNQAQADVTHATGGSVAQYETGKDRQ